MGHNVGHFIRVLAQVYNAMVIYGMCLESMIIGTMIPVPKVKRQVVCNSDNFRTSALSSIFGKSLDWIILMRENDYLCSSKFQFGFKEGVPTTQCTHVVNEIINYYNVNKANVHMLFVDASKAFDNYLNVYWSITYCLDYSACLLWCIHSKCWMLNGRQVLAISLMFQMV